MANIQVPADGSGKKVDTVTLSDAGSEVHRQKVVVTGGSGTAEVAAVTSGAAGAGAMGLVVRQAGNVGVDAISATVNVAIPTPVVVNNISAAVVVSHLSRTAAVTIATPFTVDGISKTVNVAVATPLTVNNISATVTVSGNVNISATANVAVTSVYVSGAPPSASRGPKCVIASTSANVTLVAAPGAGMAIFVTQLNCTNASGSNTRARIGTSASIGQVTMMMAQSGGGFLAQYLPVWKLSTNEALLCSVKPNASEGIFNVHFFVASADAF